MERDVVVCEINRKSTVLNGFTSACHKLKSSQRSLNYENELFLFGVFKDFFYFVRGYRSVSIFHVILI